MNRIIRLKYIVILVLILDIAYMFKQNYGIKLDGDLIAIVLPGGNYADVLKDPFGFRVLTKKETYSATNRYFCHVTMRTWFREVYKITGVFFKDKVTNLYVVSALFRTAVCLAIILLLAAYVTSAFDFNNKNFLVAILLAIPFVQIHGFNENIGIIDPSVTYTFFYGFPFCLLLIYLFPFYQYHTNDKEKISFPFWKHILWTMLAVYLAFSGPIIQPLVLLVVPTWLLTIGLSSFIKLKNVPLHDRCLQSFKSIPAVFRFHFIFIAVWCIYSYYIGLYNAENNIPGPQIAERYKILLSGLEYFFTATIAYIFIMVLLGGNIFLLKKIQISGAEKKVLRFTFVAILFSVLYVVLLPLGGYRPYRPTIVRYDTFVPVTFLVLFYIIYTSGLLLRKPTTGYVAFIVVIGLIFKLCDTPQFHANACEKYCLRTMSKSTADTLVFDRKCTIIAWNECTTFDQTRNISTMLADWGITDSMKYYIQQ